MHSESERNAIEKRLRALARRLIDQKAARVLVKPYAEAAGYWFGAGNVVQGEDGALYLAGRYRNAGDSRTGLAAGERGLELAVFRAEKHDGTWEKVACWDKTALSFGGKRVISIEGACLLQGGAGWELFVSTEKGEAYPRGFEAYQKPGTGVWSIDVLRGARPESLDAATLAPVLRPAPEPAYLHVKDPKAYREHNGSTALFFCSHPFTWASSNTGLALRERPAADFAVRSYEAVERGAAWDVAGTRVTARLPVPPMGALASMPPVRLYFYDGLECFRELPQSKQAVRRPRGYSCEEIGGLLWDGQEQSLPLARLSPNEPLFVSPWGTGCSRYVDIAVLDGGLFATWQQSQPDRSQPLVSHFLPMEAVEHILR